SRIDGVEAGVRPAGLARRTVAAAGGVGGRLLGGGLIFLFATPSPQRPNATNENVKPTQVEVAIEAMTNVARQRASEAFGMFRGMSLQEAVRSVERRCK